MLCWDLKKSGCLHFPLEFKDGALLSVSVGEGQWHVIHCGTKPHRQCYLAPRSLKIQKKTMGMVSFSAEPFILVSV